MDYLYHLQSNLDGSNSDGSFIMANSNSFLSPYEILPIAQENKYLRNFLILSWNCMLCVHSTYNPSVENRKEFPKLSIFASWTGAMINPKWLEQPMSRTNFHGPKDVRAIEVRLYLYYNMFPKYSDRRLCAMTPVQKGGENILTECFSWT